MLQQHKHMYFEKRGSRTEYKTITTKAEKVKTML